MTTKTDVIGSAESARILGIDQSTFNRWSLGGRVIPVQEYPGLTGPKLYARSAILALARARGAARANL